MEAGAVLPHTVGFIEQPVVSAARRQEWAGDEVRLEDGIGAHHKSESLPGRGKAPTPAGENLSRPRNGGDCISPAHDQSAGGAEIGSNTARSISNDGERDEIRFKYQVA